MAKRPIVQNGRLTVPLFHGTSSLYHESIQSFGLGGRDAVTDMGIRDAARFLLAYCDPYRQQEDWLLPVSGCENVAADPANDRLSNGWCFNFRYGGTYVSASSETASVYASGQGVKGGEALNEVLNLAKLLSVHIPSIYDSNHLARLIRFSQTPAKPMVVEARDVDVTSLRAEQGGSIFEILERMEYASEEESSYDGCVQQENFELTTALGSNQLRFHIPRKVKEYDEIGCSRELLILDPFVP
jgi:hypothetical protein